MSSSSQFQPIENYGIIGNLCTTALVGMNASIDFFCFPRFDSPTVFAALLDPDKGGFFRVAPANPMPGCKQMYMAGTNVLLTSFLADQGAVEITDLMPLTEHGQKNILVRIVRCLRGQVEMEMECCPALNYAQDRTTAAMELENVIFTSESKSSPIMRLQGSVPLTAEQGSAKAKFTVKKDDWALFVFGAHGEMPPGPLHYDIHQQDLQETLTYWRSWSKKSQYVGRWRETVSRSALVLKLLTSREFGSLIAAPTFALPESPGGERNWDYRYTWMRDASFTLYAFMRLGYREEAENFWRWLGARFGNLNDDQAPFQVMYGIDGRKELVETQLPNLRGYLDSQPVRIGNGAFRQLQLDIYGEVFDAMYLYSKYGHAMPHDAWDRVKKVLEWLGRNWERPDDGIWEIRSGPREFLHSRLMCWVAFDRAIRLAHKRSMSAPLNEWYGHRDAIVEDIYNNFWNEDLQAFVQSKGSDAVDASALLMPLMRFISPVDPKWLSTLKAIQDFLSEDLFVYRYRNTHTSDGLQGEEGSFTCCSFWLVECLARANRVDEAQLLFEKLLAHGNHLGLYSEELSREGRQVGNFPQALTHLALISAATYLDRALTAGAPKPWE